MLKNNRLYPAWTQHSYLVLRKRRELLRAEVARILERGRRDLILLDVGGHEKPYAPLFEPIVQHHYSLDLGHRDADIIGEGEALPFRSGSIDLVLCTQVLEHVRRPQLIIDEIHRVLKPEGRAYISVPAIFPLHGGPHDNWRFMSGGVRVLLENFQDVQVMAEGGTIASFFRTMNMYAEALFGRHQRGWMFKLCSFTIFPLNNFLGWNLDRLMKSGDFFAANWLAIAVK